MRTQGQRTLRCDRSHPGRKPMLLYSDQLATIIFATVFDYIQRILKFIRFSHTIFALPFAAGSMIVAAHGFPSVRIVLLILFAMVFARTAAMAFNRVADWEIDKENPRTAGPAQAGFQAGGMVPGVGAFCRICPCQLAD